VQRKLEVWPEFVTALNVGSVAYNEARPQSDVDCIFIFDPLDECIVPAEFIWVPSTDTYHTIFEMDAAEDGGIQIDATRMALENLRQEEWDEGRKHIAWPRPSDGWGQRRRAHEELLRDRAYYYDQQQDSTVWLRPCKRSC
jgi:hypothetical protein